MAVGSALESHSSQVQSSDPRPLEYSKSTAKQDRAAASLPGSERDTRYIVQRSQAWVVSKLMLDAVQSLFTAGPDSSLLAVRSALSQRAVLAL